MANNKLDHSANSDEMIALVRSDRKSTGWYPPARLSTVTGEVRASTVSKVPRRVSDGSLSNLPIELLSLIFVECDLLTLTRVSGTCIHLKAAVEGLPEYRDLIAHAPDTLAIIGRSDTAGLHTISTLSAAFRSYQCVSCFNYGTHLHILTCERVCMECLTRNMRFWIAKIEVAKPVLRGWLNEHEIDSIPKVHTLQWTYQDLHLSVNGSFQGEFTVPRQEFLCPVRAMELVKSKHGLTTMQMVALQLDIAIFNTLMQPQEPGRPHTLRYLFNNGGSVYHTELASIELPYFNKERTVEHGLACGGCHRLWIQAHARLCSGAWSRNTAFLSGSLQDDYERLAGKAGVLRTRKEFLRHVEECQGCIAIIEKARSRRLADANTQTIE